LPAIDAAAIADLDGDRQLDWCTANAHCARAAHRDVTTNAAPWSFALDHVVLGDLDGDHRADACSADGGTVRCARSQGYGFGPPFPVANGDYVWIGDLDGDGVNDLCTQSGDAITCIVEP
jgi:hypothetical protein